MQLESWSEFHPFAACELFKRTADVTIVRELMTELQRVEAIKQAAIPSPTGTP